MRTSTRARPKSALRKSRPVARAPGAVASLRRPGSASRLRELLQRMQTLRQAVHAAARALDRNWRPHLHKPEYLPSAANLAAYIGLRRHDLRPIQRDLTHLGLSSLGRCEGHVMATLDAVIHALKQMTGTRVTRRRIASVARAMTRDQVLLRRHTNELFGVPAANRWTRFMVTLPTEAATDYAFVRELLEHGMNCARINCGHDALPGWRAMIRNIHRARAETGRPCRILMDLGGPRLRTGPIKAAAPLLRVRIKRDQQRQPLQPAQVILDASGTIGDATPAGSARAGAPVRVAVEAAWLERIRRGDAIDFVDVRGRERRLVARKRLSDFAWLAHASHGAWIDEATVLTHTPRRATDAGPMATRIGAIPASVLDVRVEQDDLLLLTREVIPGEPKCVDKRGRMVAPAHISCSEPGIFPALKIGHRIYIDDGKIGTVIESLDERGAWLRVTHARPGGERLGPGKGLNFPDSELPLPALCRSDLANLDFAARSADIIGFSFVRSAADIDELVRELARRGRPNLGIIAKIETRAAVMDLPEIIIRGAGSHPFGVMIARGDLAVEIGYERMAEIQEEILWLCEAAHVPVVWATQVLEGLVKRGRPSRAEISDAAMAERAECVMLNKGPYLFQALSVLDNVVTRMHHHQHKKTAQFRALHW